MTESLAVSAALLFDAVPPQAPVRQASGADRKLRSG